MLHSEALSKKKILVESYMQLHFFFVRLPWSVTKSAPSGQCSDYPK